MTDFVVVGIDVGGARKGFHAVSLNRRGFRSQRTSCNASEIADWSRAQGAGVIAIDAPCRWSATGRARPAEQQLMAKRVWCFSTPTQAAAEAHPRQYYAWMLAGAAMYEHLRPTHPVYDGNSPRTSIAIETFPHAITCALANGIVSAKEKRTMRKGFLEKAGLDTKTLSNIDWIDAGLCALTAARFAAGNSSRLGDPLEGYIVVPKSEFFA